MLLIFYLLLSLGLFFLMGFGIACWSPTQSHRRVFILLSPLLGIAFTTLEGWYFYHNSFTHGTDQYARWLLVLPSLLFIGVWIFPTKRREILKVLRSHRFHRETALALAMAFGLILLISIPALKHTELTPISIGNNDFSSYSATERLIKELPLNCDTGFLCKNLTFHRLASTTVFGAYFVTSFLSSLYSLEPYQLQMVSILAYFFLLIFYSFFLLRRNFGYSIMGASVVTWIIGLHPILIATLYHSFKSQFLAMIIGLGLFIATHTSLKSRHFKTVLELLPVFVLLMWGVEAVYPHMLVVLIAFMGIQIGTAALFQKDLKRFIPHVGVLALSLIITLLLSVFRTLATLEYITYAKNTLVPWYIPWISPDKTFGFTWPAYSPQLVLDLGTSSTLFRSLPFVILTLVGFDLLSGRDRKLLIQCLFSFMFIFAGYYFLLFKNSTDGKIGNYPSYKWLSFFLPVALPICAIALQQLGRKRIPMIQQTALYACGFLLISGTSLSSFKFIKEITHNHFWVYEDLAKLQNLEKSDQFDTINVLESRPWEANWIPNFIGKKMMLYYATACYYSTAPLEGHWDLSPKSVSPIIYYQSKGKEMTFQDFIQNGTFSLSKVQDQNDRLKVRFQNGWHEVETDHRWTSNQRSFLEFKSPSKQKISKIIFDYSPLIATNRFHVFYKNQLVKDCLSQNRCELTNLDVEKGSSLLEIRADQSPKQPSPQDTRLLGMSFTKISISYEPGRKPD